MATRGSQRNRRRFRNSPEPDEFAASSAPIPHSTPHSYPAPSLQLPSQRFPSSNTSQPRPNHQIDDLHRFDNLLNSLLKHQPKTIRSFLKDCFDVYNSKYRQTQKNTPTCTPNPTKSSQPSKFNYQRQGSHESDTDAKPLEPSLITVFDRQQYLDNLVYQRWETFDIQHRYKQHDLDPQHHNPHQERQPPQKVNVGQSPESPCNEIIVWKSPKASKSPCHKIVLDPKFCCIALRDEESNPSPIHIKALSFLWHTLIEKPCTGAILNHGIGYPRTYIIFSFAHLVRTSHCYQESTILVICTPAALSQWQMSYKHAIGNVIVDFVTKTQWSADINRWRARGGVLVIDEETYANILESDESPKKRSAMAGLCYPGPDICILDEAARTNTTPSSSQLGRFLNRTRTKARLALTSLPLSGFISRAWSIVDWACPRLFGTNIEYHSKYVHPIAQGHKNNSTTDQAVEAFHRACFLFNKMSMITFTIDSTARRESLNTMGLNLHESVIWVSLSREEHAIYREVELLLGDAVKHNGLSPFLAVELLICAASSVQALRRTVETWANTNPRCVERIGGPAQEHFQQLLRTINLRLSENMISTKLQLTLHLGKQCLLENERLVIFASSQHRLDDVHKFLSSQLDETKIYLHDDSMCTSNTNKRPLDDFNIVQGGAILIAPYGPTIYCMEESGWGFINATRVLFIDSSWHSGACVQAVNRVHNFAQMTSDLQVHHFLAMDTVEYGLSVALERRYKHMLICDSSSFPENKSGLCEKSFLLAPEITPKLIRDNPPQEIIRLEAPTVKRLHNDEQNSSNSITANDDIILSLLNTANSSNEDNYVHEIILNSDRYRAMSEHLDLWMRLEWSRKARFLSGQVDESKNDKTIERYRESTHVIISYVMDAINRGLGREWLAQDCIFKEEHSGIPHLLNSWEPYRRLFECNQVSSLPRVTQSVGKKRPRTPYNQQDHRHSKNMRR